MKEVQLCGQTVRVDDEGLINLTDMWKASGGDNKHRPNLFLQNAQTKRFVDDFPKAGNPALRIIKGGNASGTWGHKKLAYKYASWIDTKFEHGVYDVLDKFFAGELQPVTSPMDEYNQLMIDEAVRKKMGSALGRGLRQCGIQKKQNKVRSKKIMNRLQTELMLDFVAPVKVIGREGV